MLVLSGCICNIIAKLLSVLFKFFVNNETHETHEKSFRNPPESVPAAAVIAFDDVLVISNKMDNAGALSWSPKSGETKPSSNLKHEMTN